MTDGGSIDWRRIADAETMIFRSSSLKLEAALAELNLMGSQVESSTIMLGEQHDVIVRSRGANAFRTALCCRLLTSLVEEMVSEQHREIFRRVSYELMLSIYEDYIPPPRAELNRADSASFKCGTQRLEHDKAAATGLTFDRVPYFEKVKALEEQMLELRCELEELRAWKREKAPILRDQREQLELMSRSKGSSDLSAQIAIVEQVRVKERKVNHFCANSEI
jgi:hypothetical protein